MEKIKIDKNIWYVILGAVIIVVLIIIAVVVPQPKQNTNDATKQNLNTSTQQQNNNTQVKTGTTTKTSEPSYTYPQALRAFKDRRFQFSNSKEGNCVMTPNSYTFKNGTKVMLDNRTDKRITVYLNGSSNTISAYYFKIVTLSTTSNLPYTIKVDCNTGKNNGQIILQK